MEERAKNPGFADRKEQRAESETVERVKNRTHGEHSRSRAEHGTVQNRTEHRENTHGREQNPRRTLTVPTFSKYPPWVPKWMSCSLKNQVNLSSRESSWDTWQGRMMLSPTVTSRWPAGLVMAVDSGDTNTHLISGCLADASSSASYDKYMCQKKEKQLYYPAVGVVRRSIQQKAKHKQSLG